ncbi:hypothetical protein JCM19314_3530 [Nonlabens ulvanivorans]|uniref:Uncharacterized protein n=1 Tax=Nonlabens ulvanivorans TaxID=906888 RepID=A0A090Q962_NONUL|nr:hypothetical protein JCM19314_3530 [Nonlabens ulvanivorans]
MLKQQIAFLWIHKKDLIAQVFFKYKMDSGLSFISHKK